MGDMKYIIERVEGKKSDYQEYNFTQKENDALKTFFDLSQEFDDIENFYDLCVAIPKCFFNLDARLYTVDPKIHTLALIAKTEDGRYELNSPPPDDIKPAEEPYYTGNNSLILTIRGKEPLIEELPFKVKDDVLGLLEIYPVRDLTEHRELFFQKYANRIGFNIHNRLLVEKNIEHLRFIRSLVADIEHNIIVPNMVYKLFLRGLKRKIEKNVELEKDFFSKSTAGLCNEACMNNFIKEFNDINQGLNEELENIEKHYKNMSLFIETLFRKSHFDQGRLTLRSKPCNMKKDVVQPQLERYIEQFKRMGITVDDRFSGIPEAEIITVVDVGLIAQVYANLFSNAVKYTQEVVTETGEKKKYVSYGREVIKDFFEPGKDGIKFNVFSTGPHIPPEERDKIFEEEYRASNVLNQPGTGHGLSFIKNAVEIHGGTVGYEATQYGNNFYFILPK
ncbi:MAG TPA: sensor histidine kinase [Nitrospirae bacterium]|nr:sensor protein KdpD [bacterium BMS3Abin06]HDH11164.1 sensor histidine kinase [Nitrospirota bacterium]HDZ02643.1 sensor histidine kinase [Nitrospirota bacterium]